MVNEIEKGLHWTGTWLSKLSSGAGGYISGTDFSKLQGFYDPVTEKMIEPEHTGISYSFTDDGHFEEAYYRAISNRMVPAVRSTSA